MAKFSILPNTLETIREVDLRPIRDQALEVVKIAIIGAAGSGRETLARQMRSDPARPQLHADTPILILDLDQSDQALTADLIILMMDSRKRDSIIEQDLVRAWHNAGKLVLVFINQIEPQQDLPTTTRAIEQTRKYVVSGSVQDAEFLLSRFTPLVIDLLRDQLLSLGRHYPLFRIPIANYLINDTCLSNAAYALSTGLAEIVAVLNFPIAVADMVILSKNQAYLAYKLGLALGFSTSWRDYLVEFGGVLGGGFVWREIARTFVGLIPVWGIIPKTAISYAGTYVIGHAILQWYRTGRHVSRKQMQGLYYQALARGRELARQLLNRFPRPRLPKLSRLGFRRRKAELPEPPSVQVCPRCGQTSSMDAHFCQYCGKPFVQD